MLDLRNNNLSGSIPVPFSRLLMLTELYLQGNEHLKGPIVTSFLTLDYSIRVKERSTDTCPMVRFSHNHGSVYVDSNYYKRQYCHCDEHYYGTGGYCFPCMEGSYCPGTTKHKTSAKPIKMLTSYAADASVSKMFLKKGYFPFPNDRNVRSIRKCPTSVYYYNICVPGKMCDCYLSHSSNDTSNTKAGDVEAVSSKVRCNSSCLCLAGHQGRFCSQCKKSYYKEGIRCYKCPQGSEKGLEFGILFGSTIITVLVSVAVFYLSLTRLKWAVALAVLEILVIFVLALKHLVPAFLVQLAIIIYALGFSTYLQRCTALLKSAIFYIQVMDTLVSTTDIWPKSIFSAQMYLSSALNFHFSSLSCIMPELFTLFSRNLILLALPMICFILIWMVYFAWKAITAPNNDKLETFNFKCRKYCIIFLDLAYFPIVSSSLAVIIGCRNIGSVSFMKSYVWVDCHSPKHGALLGIAVYDLIAYVFGVPFFIYIPLLYRHRSQLSDETSPVVKWLSPLITPYKAKYRSFIEVIMVLRRLLIAILMTSFPSNASEQTQCIAILLIAAIIFQATAKPFRNPAIDDEDVEHNLGLENMIEIFMLSSLLSSFTCVGLSIGHERFSKASALFIMTLSINGLFLLTFCCCVLYRLRPKPSDDETDVDFSDLHEPLIDVNEDYYVRQLSNDLS